MLRKKQPPSVDLRQKLDLHLNTVNQITEPARATEAGFSLGGCHAPRSCNGGMTMADLIVRWKDVSGVVRFENMIGALGKDGRKVMQRGLARAGDMARTQVYRALAAQTGLKRRVIVKAIKTKRPSYDDLRYEMLARGGDISLKYFSPRETRAGVSAAPFNQRHVFPGTFMKGGRFPNRVIAPKLGGHVWKRIGKGRNIELQDSGVIIPNEMISGETASTFTSTIARVLPQRVEHELARLMR
jgi:hypothetical protein